MPSDSSLSETDMKEALGLVSAPVKEKPSRARTYTLVELSVRKEMDDIPFCLEHRSDSISTLTAQLEAEKIARDNSLKVLSVINIRQISE